MNKSMQLFADLVAGSKQEPKIVFDPKIKTWEFDPSINKLKIPFINNNIDSRVQQGYIFSACSNFMCSTPQLWKAAAKLKINRFAYTWLNQIRSESKFISRFPLAGNVLVEFYNKMKVPTIDSKSSFFSRFWIMDKLNNREEYEIFTSYEKELAESIWGIKTDDEFLTVAVALTKLMDKESERMKQAEVPVEDKNPKDEVEQMVDDQRSLVDEYKDMIEDAEVNLDLTPDADEKPLLVKCFDPATYSPWFEHFHYSPTECLKMNESKVVEQGLARVEESLSEFKHYIQGKALALYSEFMVMRSATEYSKTRLDETGELDMEQLPFYKLSNDIFRENIISADATSHAICFFVDFSVSMFQDSKFMDTMSQVLILEQFCKLAGINHSVIAFADAGTESQMKAALAARVFKVDRHDKLTLDQYIRLFQRTPVNQIVPPPGMRMFELFNDAMADTERSKMEDLVHLMMETSVNGQLCTEFSFGRTPMNNTVLFTRDAISSIIERNPSLQKVSLMLISDQATDECCYMDEAGELRRRTGKNVPLDRIQIFNKSSDMKLYKENAVDLLRLVRNDFAENGIDIQCVLIVPGAGRIHAPSVGEYAKFKQLGVMSKLIEPGILSVWMRSSLAIYAESQKIGANDYMNQFRLSTSQEAVTKTFVKQFLEAWA